MWKKIFSILLLFVFLTFLVSCAVTANRLYAEGQAPYHQQDFHTALIGSVCFC